MTTNGEMFTLWNCGMAVSKRRIAELMGCTRQNVQILMYKYLRRHPEAAREYAGILELTRTSRGMRALIALDRGEPLSAIDQKAISRALAKQWVMESRARTHRQTKASGNIGANTTRKD